MRVNRREGRLPPERALMMRLDEDEVSVVDGVSHHARLLVVEAARRLEAGAHVEHLTDPFGAGARVACGPSHCRVIP